MDKKNVKRRSSVTTMRESVKRVLVDVNPSLHLSNDTLRVMTDLLAVVGEVLLDDKNLARLGEGRKTLRASDVECLVSLTFGMNDLGTRIRERVRDSVQRIADT